MELIRKEYDKSVIDRFNHFAVFCDKSLEKENKRINDFYEKMAKKKPDDANRLRIEDRWLLNFSLAKLIKNIF